MTTTIFSAESVSVEGRVRTGNVMVTVEGNPRDIVEDMALEDRLFDLEPRDIIDTVGPAKLLQWFTVEELTTWVQDELTDPTDLLNAIGDEAIHEYLSHGDSDSDLPN